MLARWFFLTLLLYAVASPAQQFNVDSLNRRVEKVSTVLDISLLFDQLKKGLDLLPFHEALEKSNTSLALAKKNPNVLALVFANRNVADVYDHNGEPTEAIRYLQDAVHASENSNDQLAKAVALIHLGGFLRAQNLLAEALKNILEASKIFESLKVYPDYEILCHYEACLLNYNAGSYQQAVEEGYRLVSLYGNFKSPLNPDQQFQLMSTYNTLGLANRQLQQYDIAIINYNKAEAVAQRINNEFWVGLVNGNKSVVFKDLGKYDEALRTMLEDYKLSKKHKVWGSASQAAMSISEVYLNLDDLPLAEAYLDSARILIRKDKSTSRRAMANYWKALAELSGAKGNFRKAYEAEKNFALQRDSVYKEQESLNLAKIRAAYDLDRKQDEIKLLTQNNELQEERLKSQRTLFVATLIGLILVLLLSVNLIYSFRRQKRISALVSQQRDEIEHKNKELEHQSIKLQENNQLVQTINAELEDKVASRTRELAMINQELDTFLYRSSHDIRRPITTLLGLHQVARHVIRDDQANLLFDKVVETARNMDNMLFKMQMVYELNRPAFELQPVNLNQLIENSVQYFSNEMIQSQVASHVQLRDSITIISNVVLLKIIVRNLIENAIYFRKTQMGAQPFVNISLQETSGQAEIVISDNGIGVEEKYQHQIFDLYFRGSQASKGNGLGLYLVQKAVNKLRGAITMISDYGVGTSFTISFPIVQ
ncbi:MAG: ATP-binding protein [Bacteroidota bacterium]